MLFLIFVFSTTLFGAAIVHLIRGKPLSLLVLLSVGWLVGSMSTSFIIFIITYFVPLSSAFTWTASLLQLCFVFAVKYYFNRNKQNQNSQKISNFIEIMPGIYTANFIVGTIACLFTLWLHKKIPTSYVVKARPYIEVERATILSIVDGFNSKRNSFFTYQDPLFYNNKLRLSPLPLTYSACLFSITHSFSSISFIIVMMNALSATTASYYFFAQTTSHPLICTITLFLNGGWAIFHCVTKESSDIDLLCEIGRNYKTPAKQILLEYIVFSKDSSFTLSMVLFVLAFIYSHERSLIHYRTFFLVGLLASLIPNELVAIAVFLVSFCYTNSCLLTFPFVFSVLLKWPSSFINYNPIWRDMQLHGVMFSQILVFIDMFGPLFIVLIFFPLVMNDAIFAHRFISTVFTSILFAAMFRNGPTTSDSFLVLASFAFPYMIAAACRIYQKIVQSIDQRSKGVIMGMAALLILFSMSGAWISAKRILAKVRYEFPSSGEVHSWAELIPPSDVIVSYPMQLNPIAASGRRILCGAPEDAWMRGEPFAQSFATASNATLSSIGIENVLNSIKAKYVLDDSVHHIIMNNETALRLFDVVKKNDFWVLLKLRNNSTK